MRHARAEPLKMMILTLCPRTDVNRLNHSDEATEGVA